MATKKTAEVEEPVAKAKASKASTSKTAAKETPVEKESTKAETKTKAPKAEKVASISHDMIRHKAYEIYLRTGNTNPDDNWIAAEKELKANN